MHVILIHAYLFDPKKLGGITLGGDYKQRSPYLNSIVPQSRWGTISQIRIQVLVDVFENEVNGLFGKILPIFLLTLAIYEHPLPQISNHQHFATPSPLKSADVIYGQPLGQMSTYFILESTRCLVTVQPLQGGEIE